MSQKSPNSHFEIALNLAYPLKVLATDLHVRNRHRRAQIYTTKQLEDYFALTASRAHSPLNYKRLGQVFHPKAWELFLEVSDNPFMAGLLLANIAQFLAPEQKSINVLQVRKAVAAVRETYFLIPEYRPLLTMNDTLLNFGVVSCNRHHFALLVTRGAIVVSFEETPRWNKILTFQHAR